LPREERSRYWSRLRSLRWNSSHGTFEVTGERSFAQKIKLKTN
jgi:hypothetical protein